MLGWSDGATEARRLARRIEVTPLVADADLRAAIKSYLRVESAEQDALIDRLGAAAIGHCEAFIGRLAIVRAVSETMAARGCWQRLTSTPARAVSAVEAIDGAGVATALTVGAYAIDLDAGGDAWVRAIDAGGRDVIRVRYTAGLASGFAGLPEPIAQGIVRLAAHLFTWRDGADESAPPAAVAALWRPWRRMRLA